MLKVKEANKEAWVNVSGYIDCDIVDLNNGHMAWDGSEKDKQKYIKALQKVKAYAQKKVEQYSR